MRTSTSQRPAASWLTAGQVLTAASMALLLLMQLVSGQWFPPPISVSQYGIGPWGWIFSMWALAIALAPICLDRAIGDRTSAGRLGRTLLAAGAGGALVMAIVRTQAGGAQDTWNAQVHMVASIVAQALLPLGILAMLWSTGGRWRLFGIALVALIAGALALLLLAAAGHDTAGLGEHASWAFWQAVAIVLCEVLIVTLVFAARERLRNSDAAPVLVRR